MFAVLAAALSSPAWALSYDVIDLGVLPGDSVSVGLAVNDAGQVSGNSLEFLPHGFRYTPGVGLEALGTLGGPEMTSTGEDLDSGGTVVGSSSSTDGLRAVRWSSGSGLVDLGTLPGFAWSWAWGIAESTGVIVGELSGPSPTDPHVGFVLDGAMRPLTDLAPALTDSTARDVNDAGQIVGWRDQGGGTAGFRLEADGSLTALGSLGGVVVEAHAINASGAVTGTATVADGTRKAFRFTDAGGMVELPDLGGASEGRAIDTSGTVVGESGPAGGGRPSGSLWPASGGHVSLDQLIDPGIGARIETASGISDTGLISAKGFLGPASRALLLVPVAPVLTLSVDPGTAGTTNTFTVEGLAPGASVAVIRGKGPGVTPISTWCPGVALDITSPKVLGQGTADAAGVATISVAVPARAAGLTGWFQAVSPATCDLSAPESVAF